MADDRAKALVAEHLANGEVCVVLTWKATGAFRHHEPHMRTEQLVELLRDALSQFTDAEPVKGKPH